MATDSNQNTCSDLPYDIMICRICAESCNRWFIYVTKLRIVASKYGHFSNISFMKIQIKRTLIEATSTRSLWCPRWSWFWPVHSTRKRCAAVQVVYEEHTSQVDEPHQQMQGHPRVICLTQFVVSQNKNPYEQEVILFIRKRCMHRPKHRVDGCILPYLLIYFVTTENIIRQPTLVVAYIYLSNGSSNNVMSRSIYHRDGHSDPCVLERSLSSRQRFAPFDHNPSAPVHRPASWLPPLPIPPPLPSTPLLVLL